MIYIDRLEKELEAQLDLAAGGCAGDYAGGGALNCGRGVDDFVGRLQVGVVEHVKEFGAELEPGTLGELEGLEEGDIPVGKAWAGEGVATEVADSSVDGWGECGGTEELGGTLGGGALDVEAPVESGIEVGPDGVTGIARVGGVVAELRG